MSTLRDVAERSKVPLLTAYRALSDAQTVDEGTRQAVLQAADALKYKLNVTIRDVASLAGVSTATVSYVLNDSYPVSAETRQRVMEATAALKYRPNVTARSLQASRTNLIGYAWHDLQPGQVNAILDRFTYRMAQAAEGSGYHVLTFAHPHENAVQVYEDLIQTNRVDGFIIANTNRDDSRIRRLLDMRVPFAAFGRANADWDFPYVDVDGRRGIEMAVEHLLAMGHTRIGLCGWPEGSLSGDARIQGYWDALAAAEITPLPEWVVRTLNTITDAYQAAERLMALPAGRRPTAIVCLSDVMAIGAMNYLEGVGLRVGGDVALTGFDDDPMSGYLRTPLTSLRQPIDQIAAQVVELLMAELGGISPPARQILLVPSLIVRASSCSDDTRE